MWWHACRHGCRRVYRHGLRSACRRGHSDEAARKAVPRCDPRRVVGVVVVRVAIVCPLESAASCGEARGEASRIYTCVQTGGRCVPRQPSKTFRPSRQPTRSAGVATIWLAAQQHGTAWVPSSWPPWICCRTPGTVPNAYVTERERKQDRCDRMLL